MQMDPIFPDDEHSEALAPGSTLLGGQFTIQRYLSSGGFGITYLATDSLNRTVVIKECYPEAFCARVNKSVRARTSSYQSDFESIVSLFVREARSLAKLNHSGVVGVHQVFEDNETAYMALDLVEGCDLLTIIEEDDRSLTPSQVVAMTLDLLDAVDHVHSQDLLHRDISPDNILVDLSGRPVLIDFGAAREEASRKSRVLSSVLVVKDGYSPQEFYLAGSQQFPCSDLYALAATLSHLISGEAPPNSQARLAALASSQPDLYTPLCGRFPEYDDCFLSAIDKAMSIVPAKRLQSAKDWAALIDPSRRTDQAAETTSIDAAIEKTITSLVQTANSEIPPVAATQSHASLRKPQVVSEPIRERPPVEIIPSLAEIRAEMEAWKRIHPHDQHDPDAGVFDFAAPSVILFPHAWPAATRLAAVSVVVLAGFIFGHVTLTNSTPQTSAAQSVLTSNYQSHENAKSVPD